LLTSCFVLTTLGLRHLETIERDGLGSFMGQFEGWARKRGTGERLDSVRAVLAEGVCSDVLPCSSVLTIAFSIRGVNLDATFELGTCNMAVATTRGLAGFPTDTDNSGNCRSSIHIAGFNKVRETVVAVSVINSEGGFRWGSALRALDSSLSVRVFLWSSRGIETESGFNELGHVWERVN
jgi:hypothetical protein